MKYYVKSGQLERIVIADNPLQAAEIACENRNGAILDELFIYVDERGFRAPIDDSIDTDSLPARVIPTRSVIDQDGTTTEIDEVDEMFEDYDPEY